MSNIDLIKWGLTERFAAEAKQYENLSLARVTEQQRNLYKIVCEKGILTANVSGKFIYHNEETSSGFPAVGDWVMVSIEGENAVIRQILTRKSVFGRKAAGTAKETQIVAANIDTVFICMALNSDFNLRRLERYLAIAWDSGAVPVIVLTKSDLCDDLNERLNQVSGVAFGADIIVCSGISEDGYSEVMPYITSGKTIAFIGSSGVGKSTLINFLAGEELLLTKEIRNDGRGRHTTTYRQLILLPTGGIVIDTPGMRELGAESADLEKAFSDIEILAAACRFRDCTHTSEPGCAVLEAIENGTLDASRFENYKKLQIEIKYDGLSSKQVEDEKIKRMFGSKGEMKQAMRDIKNKNHKR